MSKKLDFNSNVENEEKLIDISLEPIRKKKFRIDGDNSRILELNPSDLGIISRYKEVYPKLEALGKKIEEEMPEELEDESDIDSITKTADFLADIDKDMRDCVDYIFDSNVSEICVPNGTMYDPFAGKLRFEHIIEVLITLYEDTITKEFKKTQNRVKKYTNKYVKKS